MDKHIENDLLKVHERLFELVLGFIPLDEADNIISKEFMGYGTTIEEKLVGLESVKDLIALQTKQGKEGGGITYEVDPIFKKFFSDQTALIVDEVVIRLQGDTMANPIPMRLSTVYHYNSQVWKLFHWHASVGVETEEGDTWHVEKWKFENKKLQEKVDQKTAELKKSLDDLKATQEQLIHAEKMASLGELTAGIAHEIKNPLNFVNNFSEVSSELLEELLEEIKAERWDEVEHIANDLTDNLSKILHHGKRADGIVKGMLQHSRSGNGEKESIDINQMVDEYMRLAYHGHRAREKSFNVKLETEFDPSIPNVLIIPQEIGRVILNLFTNAFYTVAQKKEDQRDSDQFYEPTVTAVTRLKDHKIHIEISDDGQGIPGEVLKKIFQPFFTTKPTGKGTGLGLSLSYDIIKAHGGELEARSSVGEGSTFTIILPTT